MDEVHAIDVDDTLRAELSMEDCVQHILARCRSGAERRLHYIIYERRIWSESDGWSQEEYDGSNAHDQHAHFSACYESDREADRSPWMEGLDMGLSSEDREWIDGRFKAYVGDVVDRWTQEGTRVPADDDNPQQTVPSALYYGGADGAHMRYVQLTAVQQQLAELQAAVSGLQQLVAQQAGLAAGEG